MISLYVPRVITLGEGCLQEVGKIAKDLQATNLFVVTGSLMTKEPFRTALADSLQNNYLQATYFSNFSGEPTTDHLHEALIELENCGADAVVAIGGGSAIDLAKAISVFAVHKELSFDEISSQKKLERLPLIAIPTTAGTGSEATKVMVITDGEIGVKRNPGHPSLIPDAAILDPTLTVSLPKNFTAYTGMDALAHAIEAYVSTKATPMSDHFALEAIRLIGEALPIVYENGNDLQAREKMLLGSCYAGIAFSNSSTNLAHAAARPLGSRYHIPHGLCVSLLLPFVIEYGIGELEERYAVIAKSLGRSEAALGKDLVKILKEFNENFQIWADGNIYMRTQEDYLKSIPLLVDDALAGNGIMTNQKIPTFHDVEKIYQDLWLELQSQSAK